MLIRRLKSLVLIAALVILAGCGGTSPTGTSDPADVAELGRLHKLLYQAEDIESLLEHFADPFSVEVVIKRPDADTPYEVSGQVSRDDVLEDDPDDLAAQWVAAALPIVIDEDSFLELSIGEPIVDVDYTPASVTQTIRGDYLVYVDEGEEATFRQTVIIVSTWSKETGKWLLTRLSLSSTTECVANCQRFDEIRQERAELQALHQLLFDASDLETLLEHFAEPFSFRHSRATPEGVEGDEGTLGHGDVLAPEPNSLAEWFATHFPIGSFSDEYTASRIGVLPDGNNMTTYQFFEKHFEVDEGGLVKSMREWISVDATWSKETGSWLLIDLYYASGIFCENCN